MSAHVAALRSRPGVFDHRFAAVWIATLLLFAVSVAVPGGLSRGAVLSMVPFASVLAVAAAGQTLVIQQRGFDFSVGGVFLLGTALVTNSSFWVGISLAIVVSACFGLLNGLAVTRIGIAPIVATLGTSAIALGAARTISGGFAGRAPERLADIVGAKTAGVPNIAIAALLVVAVVTMMLGRTTLGRRLLLVGTSPRAALASGIDARLYIVAAYVMASTLFGIAAILFTGFINTPGLDAGTYYLMATAAAVALGGTPLTGGRASVVASVVGALFLSQLNQVVRALGAPTSVELLVTGVALLLAMVLHNVTGSRRRSAKA